MLVLVRVQICEIDVELIEACQVVLFLVLYLVLFWVQLVN